MIEYEPQSRVYPTLNGIPFVKCSCVVALPERLGRFITRPLSSACWRLLYPPHLNVYILTSFRSSFSTSIKPQARHRRRSLFFHSLPPQPYSRRSTHQVLYSGAVPCDLHCTDIVLSLSSTKKPSIYQDVDSNLPFFPQTTARAPTPSLEICRPRSHRRLGRQARGVPPYLFYGNLPPLKPRT